MERKLEKKKIKLEKLLSKLEKTRKVCACVCMGKNCRVTHAYTLVISKLFHTLCFYNLLVFNLGDLSKQ